MWTLGSFSLCAKNTHAEANNGTLFLNFSVFLARKMFSSVNEYFSGSQGLRLKGVFFNNLTVVTDIKKTKLSSGKLPRNINGSSRFCKNYYTHLNFSVVTFLTKIQNWCKQKTCQNTIVKKIWMVKTTTIQKIWMVKTTTIQKIWMGKTTTIQEFWLPYKKWEVVEFPSHFFY